MRRHEGIVIVTALLVLAFVAVLGLSAMALSDMNLRVAENTRTQTVARYRSETGLDTALVLLAREYKNKNGVLPTKAEFETLFSGNSDYQLLTYTPTTPTDKVTVSVKGIGPSGAEYVTEARIEGVFTPAVVTSEMDPRYGDGFVTNGKVTFNGNSNLELNVWAGNDINFTGGRSSLAAGFWARSADNQCRIGQIRCQTGQAPPNVDKPDFDTMRTSIAADTLTKAGVTIGVSKDDPNYAATVQSKLSAYCASPSSRTLSGTVTKNSTHDTVYCLAPNTKLTLTGDTSNTVIIGDDSTTVYLNADTGKKSGVLKEKGVIIASGTVDLTDSSHQMNGSNTIVAKKNIDLKKGILSTDNTVRTFIVTEGEVVLNGNGGRNINASFWTGKQWRINGTIGDFVGTVVTYEGGTGITGNGGVNLARLPDRIDNDYIPRITTTTALQDAGIRVLSRR